MKKTKGTFGGCDGLMAFKTRKIMMAFVGAIGAIWLFGATNLPRAIAVGDSVKMAMTVGAAVKIPFKVVDDAGTPVSGAKIMVGMWMGTVKDNGADGVTDTIICWNVGTAFCRAILLWRTRIRFSQQTTPVPVLQLLERLQRLRFTVLLA